MVTLKIYDTKPEIQDRFYSNLLQNLEISSAFKRLAYKSDAGFHRSERGYQMVGAATARQLARALGCSEDKTEALCRAVGICFPKYGQEGLKVVKQYVTEKNLDMDPELLEVYMIEYSIRRCGWLVNAELDQLLRGYFSENDSCQELKIVRQVQDTLKAVKIAERFHEGDPGKLLFDVTWELVDWAKEHKKLGESSILKGYAEQIASYQMPQLTAAEREEVYEVLDRYILEFCKEGKSSSDRTPEDAVMIYIYLYDE